MAALVSCAALFLFESIRALSFAATAAAAPPPPAFAQGDSFPQPPADHTLVYILDERGALTPLPFESGSTPLKVEEVANNDKMSYVELKGATAATLIATVSPRFYLFVAKRDGVHPPFLVRLAAKRNARRVTAIAQKGLRGYAVASEEIVKPHYRVLLERDGEMYMEIRPREPLAPGEYAIMGTDLERIAAFRLGQAAPAPRP